MRKRHEVDVIELENWRMVFETGHNFFTWDHNIGVDARDEAAFLPAARDAWQRLGAAFLDGWEPGYTNVKRPWALEQFGDPSGKLKNPRKLTR